MCMHTHTCILFVCVCVYIYIVHACVCKCASNAEWPAVTGKAEGLPCRVFDSGRVYRFLEVPWRTREPPLCAGTSKLAADVRISL